MQTTMISRCRAFAGVLALLLLGSCSDDSTGPEDPGPPVATKVVACEFFANYASFLCVHADSALQAAMDAVGRERVVDVSPHVNFPGQADPMYNFNPTANQARILFNQVAGTPTTLVDGQSVPQTEITSVTAIQARIAAALEVPAPVALAVHDTLTATTYQVTVDLWGVESMIPSDLTLFTWVVEREVVLDQPGQNGQTHYTNVLRELLPVPGAGSTGGEALGAIAAEEHRHFEYTYDLPAGVDPAQLAAVAFVQGPSPQRKVVQAGASF